MVGSHGRGRLAHGVLCHVDGLHVRSVILLARLEHVTLVSDDVTSSCWTILINHLHWTRRVAGDHVRLHCSSVLSSSRLEGRSSCSIGQGI